MDSSTGDGVGRATGLEEALRAFAVAVKVDGPGAKGGGQLATSNELTLGRLGGGARP